MKWLSGIRIDWTLFKNIIIIVLVQRLLLFGVGLFSDRILSFEPSYPYFESVLKQYGPAWFVKWGGFDGVHYLTIVEKGYVGTGLIQAFFPLYPILVRIFSHTFSPVFGGLFLSFTCFVFALYVWVILLRVRRIRLPWWIAILPWMISPMSLYFGALYTESLFLLLVFLVVYFSQKKLWFAASVSAALASATRIVGVACVLYIAIGMMYDWWKQQSHTKIPWVHVIWLVIGASGLFAFMTYLYVVFHDPLFFLHVQEGFGAGRSGRFVLLPQVLYRYIRILFTPHTWTWSYYAYAQEFIVTIGVFVFLLCTTYKKWKTSLAELVFSWSVFLIPPLTGTLQSMPRYVLVIFPLFFAWSTLYNTRRVLFWVICAVSTVFLILNTILFLQGRWVA